MTFSSPLGPGVVGRGDVSKGETGEPGIIGLGPGGGGRAATGHGHHR